MQFNVRINKNSKIQSFICPYIDVYNCQFAIRDFFFVGLVGFFVFFFLKTISQERAESGSES